MRAAPIHSLPCAFVFSAVLLGTALIQTSTFAHEPDDPEDHTYRPGYDPDSNRSEQYGAIEFRIGPYLPQVDKELGSSPYEATFGPNPSVTVGLEGDYQVLRIPYFGTLGPGLGIHWFRRGGIAEFTSGDPGSAHKNSLWIIPMYAVGVLRVDVFRRAFHIPLVPYIKGGLAWSLWSSRDAGSVSVVDGEKAKGSSLGLQYQVGLMLHLNPISPQTAIDMDNSSGINHSYIFAEWWASDVDSFGKGMQTGDATWVAGVALEF